MTGKDESLEGYNALQPLSAQMKCGLLATPKGDILILHEKRLPYDLEWVECSVDNKMVYLIDELGNMHDLGVEINDSMIKNLSSGIEITLMQLNEDEIVKVQKVSLIIQNY